MNNRTCALVLGIAFALATGGVSQAMSHLVAVSVVPELSVTSDTATVTSYQVTLTRTGQGLLAVSLSSLGLPEGVTATFSPSVVRFAGRVPETLTATLTISCPNDLPLSPCTFTVTGVARRETVTATAQLSLQRPLLSSRLPVLALDPPAAAGITLRGLGAIGATYQVEATSDLGNPSWTSIGSTTADDNGLFVFLDTQAKDVPARFYRTRVLEPVAVAVPKP